MSIHEINRIAVTEAEKIAVAQYYNQFINEDEEMPASAPQSNLIRYLVDLLRWHFRDKNWFIIGDLPLYQPLYNPVGPDVAIFKDMLEPIAVLDDLDSWRMEEPNRPAPAVVFEIASGSTWRTDLEYKIGRYGQLGVQEYFVYDPYRTKLWKGMRLRGWQYNFEGLARELGTNGQDWLWSKELQLWLADARPKIDVYRSNGERVLERAEEEYLGRVAAEQREAAERATRLLVEQHEAAEHAILQKLLAKLKEHGIDPDRL